MNVRFSKKTPITKDISNKKNLKIFLEITISANKKGRNIKAKWEGSVKKINDLCS